jgi:tRNA (adenine57-N1/adenine58-N1)-methyltransferase
VLLLTRGDREFLCEPGEEVHTDLGVLHVPDDAAPGDTVETHLGEPFSVRSLRGPDCFEHFERTGAPMLPRDVGQILGTTGIAEGDRVLDAGTGTGVLAAYMARAGAEVLTFERDPEFAAVARENMALAEVGDAVEVRAGDVAEALPELGAFDAVTLDTGDAPAVVESVPDHLVSGGFLASYSPFVENAREVHETATGGLSEVRTVETIQRRMQFDERGSRPSTGPVGHTGYLTFARKF